MPSFKFFLYTFLGSVLMLVAMIGDVCRGRYHRHPERF